jgi:hypothetical protein
MIWESEAICLVNESVSGTFHLKRIKLYIYRKSMKEDNLANEKSGIR